VLKFLKKTTPEFSISREAAKLLEEAVKSKYPEIWKAVEEAMKE
jgi:histone H3/H4